MDGTEVLLRAESPPHMKQAPDGLAPLRGFVINEDVQRRILLGVLHGASDANVRFDELCSLLKNLGFDMRVKGSHHIFTREDVAEILNLQPRSSMAKPYQGSRRPGVHCRGAGPSRLRGGRADPKGSAGERRDRDRRVARNRAGTRPAHSRT